MKSKKSSKAGVICREPPTKNRAATQVDWGMMTAKTKAMARKAIKYSIFNIKYNTPAVQEEGKKEGRLLKEGRRFIKERNEGRKEEARL
jgi:formylmethanofuran dehydrogenase subunit B